ncbi:MAG: DUF2807 domain-containing protein [Bacteroidaceae bacterium]|nr:DUF2807 domain-containing protein [Bacteroidaceae bacterium]
MGKRIFISVAMLIMLTACYNKTSEHSTEGTAQPSKKSKATRNHVIRKHIIIPHDFSYLTNMGSIDVIYTQGNYNIEVEGDSTLISYLETNFDSNLLTISLPTESNVDINLYGNTSNIRMYLSCPDLKCVSICGNGNFECPTNWHTEDLQLGALGTGMMNLGNIECSTFSLQSTSIGDVTINNLKAEDATIYSRSSAHISAHVDLKNLLIYNEGSQTIHLTGKAQKLLLNRPDDPNFINELE